MNYISIIDWLDREQIKNEKGERIEFKNHLYLYDIYRDESPYLVVIKAAQVGLSTLEILKNIYDAFTKGMDIIYTLPSIEDVQKFVGGKVNRIIRQNPILQSWVKDKDSVEQKAVGEAMLYFQGTISKSAAIMTSADRVVNDEKDTSNQPNLKEYESRLQHSKWKQKHVFSHPSVPDFGVDVEWKESDQKEWFITCKTCKGEQILTWNLTDPTEMSIDMDRKIFVCKLCGHELSDNERRIGRWRPKKFNHTPKYSGYHISLLMSPIHSAADILKIYNDPDQTEQFFYNKVLGLPWVGAGDKLVKDQLFQNLSEQVPNLRQDERVILGIDTGNKLDFVVGTKNGLYKATSTDKYKDLDWWMEQYPNAIAIIDAGGDLTSTKEFQERWQGRVWRCYLTGDSITNEDPNWKDDDYTVVVPRETWIQIVVDEFSKGLLPLKGQENDWWEYWLDWNNLRRTKIRDPITNAFKRYKWVRSGRDHKALATVFWRVGFSRFHTGESMFVAASSEKDSVQWAPYRTVDGMMEGKAIELTMPEIPAKGDDWRWR